MGQILFIFVFSVHTTWDTIGLSHVGWMCDSILKGDLQELRIIKLEKSSLKRRQDCYLWMFEGLTCGRRRAEWEHYVAASNRQIFMCHTSAEEQFDRSRQWVRKILRHGVALCYPERIWNMRRGLRMGSLWNLVLCSTKTEEVPMKENEKEQLGCRRKFRRRLREVVVLEG